MAGNKKRVFDWDDANLAHIARHGIARAEADEVLAGASIGLERGERGGEERHVELGETVRAGCSWWSGHGGTARSVSSPPFLPSGSSARCTAESGREGNMARRKSASARDEAEEARWFEENQDRLLKLFEQAEREGGLRIGKRVVGITLSKRAASLLKPRSQKVMLRIPTEDLERARRLAAKRGLGYQTYIKMLLRQGMDREAPSPRVRRIQGSPR
jgi:predicted DNA binding CopG/RHH family protein